MSLCLCVQLEPEKITDLSALGNLVGGFKPENLMKIPTKAFKDVDLLKKFDLRDSQRRAILSKV